VTEALRAVPLFADLTDDDLAELSKGIEPCSLEAGELLFAEGEEGDRAYVITGGEVEIFKMSGKREVLLAVRGEDTVIGEMALLESMPRNASVRAKSHVTMLAIGKEQLDALLNTSASASYALFQQVLTRLRQNQSQLRQSERMAQLGTLTAGLAHELNNPAAAVRRGADQLRDAIADYVSKVAALSAGGIDPGDKRISPLMRPADARAEPLDALARSDLEDELEDHLDELGVEEPWKLAPELVDAGMTREAIDSVVDQFGAEAAARVLRTAAAAGGALGLLHEVEEGASRLSAIVGALKSYSYLDQAPVQEIDVTKGLDDTVLILKSKLKDIEVRREYAEGLPVIQAYGSELNQVWTNLIDNAAYALTDHDVQGASIVIRAFQEGTEVVVEVEDNGPGIPDDIQARVFDSFFTTKPPGSGTGLGLDISYSIIVNKHAGDLAVDSEPGRTTFRATIPMEHQE
jgi:signal transduction histidine kinase